MIPVCFAALRSFDISLCYNSLDFRHHFVVILSQSGKGVIMKYSPNFRPCDGAFCDISYCCFLRGDSVHQRSLPYLYSSTSPAGFTAIRNTCSRLTHSQVLTKHFVNAGRVFLRSRNYKQLLQCSLNSHNAKLFFITLETRGFSSI